VRTVLKPWNVRRARAGGAVVRRTCSVGSRAAARKSQSPRGRENQSAGGRSVRARALATIAA